LLRRLWRFACNQKQTAQPPPRIERLGRPRGCNIEASEPPANSLRWFFRNHYLPLKLRSRAKNTKRLYEFTIRNYCAFLGREAMLSDLNDDQVGRLIGWMIQRGRSPFTANKERSQLLAIWNFAARKRFVEQFPDVEAEKAPSRIPKAWLASDLTKLWRALEAVEGQIAGIRAADWWVALHLVLWFSFERIGAVMALRWSDVDLETGWLTMRAETRKGGREDKSCRLHPVAIEALKQIREPERELIFPWPCSTTYLYPCYERILKAAGLPTDCKSKFHRMRKSAASHYDRLRRGAATEILGHSDPKTTRAYLDPRLTAVEQPCDVLFVPGAKGGVA
jgi:integrase